MPTNTDGAEKAIAVCGCGWRSPLVKTARAQVLAIRHCEKCGGPVDVKPVIS